MTASGASGRPVVVPGRLAPLDLSPQLEVLLVRRVDLDARQLRAGNRSKTKRTSRAMWSASGSVPS